MHSEEDRLLDFNRAHGLLSDINVSWAFKALALFLL